MIKNYIENANFEDTGFAYALSLISGKHKMVILYCLMEFETVRFNELKRDLKTISDKTLSTNLKVSDDRAGSALYLGRRKQIAELAFPCSLSIYTTIHK